MNVNMKKTLVAVAFALPLVAVESTSRAEQSVPYSVPEEVLSSSDLAEYSVFEASDVELRLRDDGRMRLEYNMPTALVGRELRFELEGRYENDAVLRLRGGEGLLDSEGRAIRAFARCTQNVAQEYDCKVHYSDLDIDPDSVAAVIAAQFPDVQEASKRLEVASAFGNDPIGVLHGLQRRDD